MTITEQVADIERQIAELKRRRDGLLRDAGLTQKELERILRMRSRDRTICQLLRELHAALDGAEREKVEQALLIAKKMDAKLVEYAGKRYNKDWYGKDGKFNG
jgi:DNA-binding transcriptional MerR regulator